MEYFDLLDENGNLTGEKKLRNLVHQDGDWHKSVHVWIVNSDNKVLMQKRSANKESHPNMWDISFAGHITSGDTSIETVIKEGGEELSIDIVESEIQFLFTYKKQTVLNNGTFINNEFNDVYLLRKNLDISTVKLQKEEVSEIKWFSIGEIKDILKEKREGYLIHEKEYEALIDLIK
jgi:isopentenyl-diphosphate delta-isomerase type 1